MRRRVLLDKPSKYLKVIPTEPIWIDVNLPGYYNVISNVSWVVT